MPENHISIVCIHLNCSKYGQTREIQTSSPLAKHRLALCQSVLWVQPHSFCPAHPHFPQSSRGPMEAGGVTKRTRHQHRAAAPRLLPSPQAFPSCHLRHPPSNSSKDSQRNLQETNNTILNKVTPSQGFGAISELLNSRWGWDTSATEQVQCHPGPAWRHPHPQTWSWGSAWNALVSSA